MQKEIMVSNILWASAKLSFIVNASDFVKAQQQN